MINDLMNNFPAWKPQKGEKGRKRKKKQPATAKTLVLPFTIMQPLLCNVNYVSGAILFQCV